MAKKKVIKGSRLRLLEAIAKIDEDLTRINDEIHQHRSHMEEKRKLKKIVQFERNRLIMEAVTRHIPMTQIAQRIGKTKVAIFLMKKEGEYGDQER